MTLRSPTGPARRSAISQLAMPQKDEDGLTYWTMGTPIEETIIINRCKKEDTYEVRLAEGRLPE